MGFNITHHTTAMSPSHTTFHRQQHNHVSLSNTLPFTTLISTANAYQSYTNFSAICITSHTHNQYYSSKLYFEQPVHVSNWSNNPLNLSQQQMEPCVSPSPTNKHSSSFKYVAPITQQNQNIISGSCKIFSKISLVKYPPKFLNIYRHAMNAELNALMNQMPIADSRRDWWEL